MSKPAPTMTIGWKDEILNILLKKKEPKWDIDSPSDHSICLYHHQHLVVSSANLLTFRFYSIISFSIFFWYFFSFLASSSVTPQCSFLSSALLLHFQIPDLFAFPTSLALGQLLYTAVRPFLSNDDSRFLGFSLDIGCYLITTGVWYVHCSSLIMRCWDTRCSLMGPHWLIYPILSYPGTTLTLLLRPTPPTGCNCQVVA